MEYLKQTIPQEIDTNINERNLAALQAKCVGRGGFRAVTSALSLGVTNHSNSYVAFLIGQNPFPIDTTGDFELALENESLCYEDARQEMC